MEQYLQHLKAIVQRGETSGDRTGTGTRRLQGLQMRFDLQEGFPMVTSKKVSFGFIKKELQWLLAGNTSNSVLRDDLKCSIWNEWADEHGRLGPIYGAMWRRRPAAKIEIVEQPLNTEIGVYLNEKEAELAITQAHRVLGGQAKAVRNPVFVVWRQMMRLVATPRAVSQDTRVPETMQKRSLHASWLDFRNFAKDFYSIPGCELTAEGDASTWFFTTVNGGSGIYAKHTLSIVETYKQSFLPLAHMRTVFELHEKGIFDRVFVPRFYIDQLGEAIELIKNNPNSRRIIVDSWEPSMLPNEPALKPHEQAAVGRMALAPCHTLFQFFVVPQGKDKKAKLSLSLTQRSGDWALGIPYNIASYALLTHLVARECDLDVGELIHTTGDCHVYANHIEAARNQIRRKTHKLPTLVLDESIKKVSDFTHDKASLLCYVHGPEIKYDVAI